MPRRNQRRVKRQPTTRNSARSGAKLSWKERFKPANIKSFVFSRRGAKFFAGLVGAGFLIIFLVFLYFAKDLPSPNKINSIVNAQTTKFYDRTGQTLLYEVYGNQNRSVITLDNMGKNIQDATVAVEDHNFYKEGAFSIIGILRAAFLDVTCHCGLQGGSTITQQYVKNALLTNNRSVSRKIKELILSIEISSFYSKNQVLQLYLNEIPYGSNAYGIEAACKTFFSYHGTTNCAKQLTVDEAAMLAAIPQAPTYYSPYGEHTDLLLDRQRLVLDDMAKYGFITKAQADAAKKVDTIAKINPTQNLYANIIAPHFVLYTQELLEQQYGTSTVTEGGLKVITTLNLTQQHEAEQAITNNMNHVRFAGGHNAALVSADPNTGQILSMVGSYNFGDPNFGAFNVATAQRQPGSSFKPFVYATAWSQGSSCESPNGCGPGTSMYNVVTDFGGGYKPLNFPGDPSSSVESMRSSLGNSLNVPAVKALYMAGVQNSIDTAQKMGLTTLTQPADSYGLSLVLGSGDVRLIDMVNAYESFANMGLHYQPTTILKVSDSNGNVLQEWKPPKSAQRVLDPQVAYLMNNVLADINAKRPAFNPDLGYFEFPGHTVAAKTGTTEHFGDAWTMGYSPSLVAGVWVGNNDNTPMTLQAADVAAPLWHAFMAAALTNTPNQTWTQPAGIKQVTLDANTGRLPVNGSKDPTRTDIFPSWYKPATASDAKSAQVDKVSGKLATSCTPPLAVETEYSSDIHAEIPPSDLAYSRWEPPVVALATSLGYPPGGTLPTDSDNIHNCSDSKPTIKFAPITQNSDGSYQLSATWSSGTFPVNDIKFELNDTVISDDTGAAPSGTYSFAYTTTNNGNFTFRALATDTGLYQAEDDQSYNVNGGGQTAAFRGVNPSGSSPGTLQNFIWTIDSSAEPGAKYQLYLDNNAVGNLTTSTSANNVPVPTHGAHSWFVRSYTNAGLSSPVSQTATLNFNN